MPAISEKDALIECLQAEFSSDASGDAERYHDTRSDRSEPEPMVKGPAKENEEGGKEERRVGMFPKGGANKSDDEVGVPEIKMGITKGESVFFGVIAAFLEKVGNACHRHATAHAVVLDELHGEEDDGCPDEGLGHYGES